MSTHYCSRCLTTFQGSPPHCPNLTCGKPPADDGWGTVLGAGDLLDRHYLIERVLAIGGAGLTYLAREVDDAGAPSGPKLAIKVLYTQRDAGPFLRRLSNEAQILQDLDHRHIVRCRGFVHRTGQEPYLITLFEEGGALTALVEERRGLSPRVAAGILIQVLQALDVAHQRGVVHRDLKPDNILLHAVPARGQVPEVRVADFGIAKVVGGVGEGLTRTGTFIGTPEYAAPEQFQGLVPTPATDVFAAGGVLFYLLTGRPPVSFSHRHDIGTSHDELLALLPPKLPPETTDSMTLGTVQEAIDGMMAPLPTQRWTVQQVLARLRTLLDGTPVAQVYTDEGAPSRAARPPHESGTGQVTLAGAEGETLSMPRPRLDGDPPGAGETEGPLRGLETTWVPVKKSEAAAPPPEVTPGAALDSATPHDPSGERTEASEREGATTPRGRGRAGWFLAMVALAGAGAVGLVFAAAGGLLLVSGDQGTPPVGLGAAEQAAIEESLLRHGKDIGALCGVSGASVRAALTLEPTGAISVAELDPAALPRGVDCVGRALEGVSVPRRSAGRALIRTTIVLP